MNRASDEGNQHFILRSYFFTLLPFLRFKFKGFNQKVFCEKAVLKFPQKQMQWASATPNSHTGPAKRFEIAENSKFLPSVRRWLNLILTGFTSVLTLLSLKTEEKIYRYFYSNWYFIFG